MNANLDQFHNSLPSISIDNVVLIDILKYMWGIHQNTNRAGCGDGEENVQLKTINDHGHVFPVFAYLKRDTGQALVHEGR